MIICEGCGANYKETSAQCPYCGRSKPEKPKSQRGFDLGRSVASGLECPLCHHDDRVAKVSAIIQSDTQHINGSVPVSSTYRDSSGQIRSSTSQESYSATQESELAKKLAPPSKPSGGGSYVWAFLIAPFLFFPICGGIGLAMDENNVGYIGCTIAGLIALLIIIKIARYQHKKDDIKMQPKIMAWNKAMERWNKLYYCYRDGCVYIPGEEGSSSISDMTTFLYR